MCSNTYFIEQDTKYCAKTKNDTKYRLHVLYILSYNSTSKSYDGSCQLPEEVMLMVGKSIWEDSFMTFDVIGLCGLLVTLVAFAYQVHQDNKKK